jgi:hypothetical protein
VRKVSNHEHKNKKLWNISSFTYLNAMITHITLAIRTILKKEALINQSWSEVSRLAKKKFKK